MTECSMSKEVKRYTFFAYLDDDVAELDCHVSEDGGYVSWDGYDALRAELAEANADFVRIANERESLLAERDSLKKDAERYRLLSKVTPYRFKKLQESATTDGGDVFYFHRDRFDAAIDAALQGEQP